MIRTPMIRRQLWIFATVGALAISVTGVYYAQIPQSFGIGRYSVTVELENGAGLYTNANVSYRGTTVGRVERMENTPSGAVAVLSMDSSVKIPVDLDAAVRSMSAIGEQYVEFTPRTNTEPFLHDRSVVPVDRTSVPTEIGPTLDQLEAMLVAVGPEDLHTVLEESFTALDGTGPQLRALIDSMKELSSAAAESKDPIKTLIEQLGPLLDTQVVSSESIRQWATALESVTAQISGNDPHLRNVLDKSTATAEQSRQLFRQLQPTLPILLANIVTVEQVAAVYNPALEQIFVLYPNVIAASQGGGLPHADDPMQNTFFANQYNDPPPCLEGFLPPSERRSPTETDVPETPKDLYCKVAPDDPRSVRGARNLPCLEFPGRRAATVQLCRMVDGQDSPATEDVTGGIANATTGQYDPIAGSYLGTDGLRYTDRSLTDSGSSPRDLRSLLVPDK
ncbi:MlaD family protein [Rhodococcus erythropolis]|uniref:MCE family protein n=1 Tax=Rhodococcus erythropolis TaxID=1833 RepID=UPI001E32461A|nr:MULTISPECIES: MlaD family protein [Rhodococcus erythropolis group]MCD2107916.1 MCE family protein [Rhodococcus qingshengii]MCZ4527087.1 MlaD family protein [Rhodococcus erythropolis]